MMIASSFSKECVFDKFRAGHSPISVYDVNIREF